MRTKIALTIQLLIHGDFNCAAVETGESRKMSRCSRPQPTITFSATESFHNQLRNPGLSGVRVALFGFGLMPNHFHAVLELVLAVAADTGVWNSKYVTSARAAEK
jgi:hypothetical protein